MFFGKPSAQSLIEQAISIVGESVNLERWYSNLSEDDQATRFRDYRLYWGSHARLAARVIKQMKRHGGFDEWIKVSAEIAPELLELKEADNLLQMDIFLLQNKKAIVSQLKFTLWAAIPQWKDMEVMEFENSLLLKWRSQKVSS
ncbi:MAG: hypothetical protein CMJ32_06920 [Phycisphaerae bacterium]|nr:hypothetical protein [Phycisphaerae bacterium]